MLIALNMSRIWLPRAVLVDMEFIADASFPLETGGMLIGYTADNGELVVEKLIGPGPNAKHESHYFEPDSIYQQTLLDQYFRESEGRTTYLGDWHTHPNGSTALSATDKRTLSNIATTPSSQNKNPVMGVLAGNGKNWEFGVVQFLGAYRRLLIRQYALLPLKIELFIE